MLTETAVLCLSLVMYSEARGEPTEAMQAVGDTVIYRLNHNEEYQDVCQVVLKKKQFSWTRKLKEKSVFGLMDYQEKILRGIKQKDLIAYRKAEKMAVKMLSDDYRPKYHYSHFYDGKAPSWAKGKPSRKIGALHFMKGVK